MMGHFQTSIQLASVENILRMQCEQKQKHVFENEIYEIADVTFCWC